MPGQKVSCSAANDATAYFYIHSADQPKSLRFTQVGFAGGEPTMTISRFAEVLDIVTLGTSLARSLFEEARPIISSFGRRIKGGN